MNAKLCIAVLSFALASLAQAGEIPSVTAWGQKISVGDTADSVFAVLGQDDMVGQDIEKTASGLFKGVG